LEDNDAQAVAVSLFGGPKIIVTKDLPPILGGFSILGSKEMKPSQAKEPPPTSAKQLLIISISIFGNAQ